MTLWLTVIGGVVTSVGLVLRWYLSAEQRQKRKDSYVWKLEKELRRAIANNDNDSILWVSNELRLYAEKGSPAAEPDDPDNASG